MNMLEERPVSAHAYLDLNDQHLLAQCEVDCYRSRGPGGQKRNKTSSAVRLRHTPTGLIVIATEDRSQHVNKRRAVRRLREAIALNVRAGESGAVGDPADRITDFIDADGNLALSRRDERYHAVVAHVLDTIDACHTRIRDSARLLGLSTAHLVKFLGKNPKLWDRMNRMRTAAGQPPLRNRRK